MCIRYWKRADDYIAGMLGAATLVAAIVGGLGVARTTSTMDDRYDLMSVAVDSPTTLGELVQVSVLRRIRADFPGRYSTTVRQVDSVSPVCNGGDYIPYKAEDEAALANDPVAVRRALDWWTAGARPPCQQEVDRLSPGTFVLTVCIHDESGGFMNRFWPRFVCKDSNLFEVIP